jgi:hypothetical protein
MFALNQQKDKMFQDSLFFFIKKKEERKKKDQMF